MFVMENDRDDVVRHWEFPPSDPVVIESNVWIGSKVAILPGVRIGSRTGFGAGVSLPRIFLRDVSPRDILRACFITSRNSTSSCLVFGLPIVTRWAEKFRSDRGGEPLVALIARIQ